jgi:hypothetical protein
VAAWATASAAVLDVVPEFPWFPAAVVAASRTLLAVAPCCWAASVAAWATASAAVWAWVLAASNAVWRAWSSAKEGLKRRTTMAWLPPLR